MLIFDVDLGQSCQSWSIFGLLILKLALRGSDKAHWVAPLTSMHLRSESLTLANTDLNADTDLWQIQTYGDNFAIF